MDRNSEHPIVLKENFNVENVETSNISTDAFITQLCTEFPNVFKKGLGCLKDYIHNIRPIPNAKPVCSKVRSVPFAVREDMRHELQKLKADGIIEEIEGTEWLAPVVAARKPNGNLRLCVDPRELNKNVVIDKYPLPNITDMLMLLEGSSVFSNIDLNSAYHQIMLEEHSKDLTAFITPFGTFRYTRLPFGLVSAASVF